MHTTPVSLLKRLRTDTNSADWDRFADLYTPLPFYWARKAGLSEQDASDLVQEVFVVLLQKLPEFQYDSQRSFRGWM